MLPDKTAAWMLLSACAPCGPVPASGMNDLLHRFVLSFIPLFVALDAVGNIPFFLSLTDGIEPGERTRVANVSTLAAAAIALFFMLGGRFVLNLMGICVCDFRIAGGALLLVLSTHMLIAGKTVNVAPEEVAIFPLATPLMAGPAVLTTTLLLVGTLGFVLTLFSLILNMAITWAVFRNAHRIELLITKQGAKAFSKVMEILLAAIAVMMIRSGVEGAILQFIAGHEPVGH